MLRGIVAWWDGATMQRAVWSGDRELALGGAEEYVTLGFEFNVGGDDTSDSLEEFIRRVRECEDNAAGDSGSMIVCLRERALRFSKAGEPDSTLLFYRGEVIGPPGATKRALSAVEGRFCDSLRSMFGPANTMHSVDIFARRIDARSGPEGVLFRD